ncbi:MAG TPA: YceI family protein [Flavisolibacter sp.]|nr:YceI family protein [Flavisolibacter sp.]
MKKLSLKHIVLSFILGICITSIGMAQQTSRSNIMDIRLNGTSSLHDWEMKAVKGTSEISYVVDAKGNITSISKLTFSLPAKNLKSDHTMMDNNTYKALKADNNPNLSFVLTSAKITATGSNTYQLNCSGKLTIAGTTRETQLIATGKYNASEKTFTVTGLQKMKMTDYNVTPPKAMLGTIKTGNDISISYNVKFS